MELNKEKRCKHEIRLMVIDVDGGCDCGGANYGSRKIDIVI